ncbi:MAG: NAD(P)H-binding protein [Xanthomonadaceae bacterium]|nr:NAD(P)H-binding protein [Xanthomonadaceae bacterium]
MRAGDERVPAAIRAFPATDAAHADRAGASDGTPPKVLVLGGAGFIGRHAVAALQRQGCAAIIGTRDPRRRARERTTLQAQPGDRPYDSAAPEYREAHLERLLDAEDWTPLLDGVDRVINCVGILRERGRETYDRVHHRAVAALAAACAARDLRLIHVSALGLEGPARSGFLRSKCDGERALRESGADWRIVRPSLLDGDDGYGARWLRRVARWPIHPLPRGATGRIAVLRVDDLGEALAALALRETIDGDAHAPMREFDLGGNVERTLAEYLAALRALRHPRPAYRMRVPDAPTRLLAHVCDLLHATPFSFGHWELLRRDNRPAFNALPMLLGRMPRAVGADTPTLVEPDRAPHYGPALRPAWQEPGES